MFSAETSALNDSFAARLKAFLETHFAFSAFYEDEIRRFHNAAQTGNVQAPFPREAEQKVGAIVEANTPSVFSPRVAEGLRKAERGAPKVELEAEDLRGRAPIQPPIYPFGHLDYEKARRLGIGGSINALYGVLWRELTKDPEKTAARIVILKELYDAAKPIFDYLRKISGI